MVKLNVNTSVVDYLKSKGQDSSFNNRTTLAGQNKINNYTGTAPQNIQLLNTLKTNQVKPVPVAKPVAVAPKPTVKPTTKPVVAPAKPPIKTTKPVTPKPAPAPTTPVFDMQAYMKAQQNSVNGLYDQMQKAQTDAYTANRDKAIGDINYQKEQVAPQYQGMRNQTDVANLQNAQKLQELMASRGLGASGENVTATVNQNNARQNSLNSLNLQEQQTNNDFDHQIANLNDPAELNALIANIGTQRAQALMDANNRADEVGYSRGRDAIGDQRYTAETAYSHGQDAKQNAYAEAGITGKYNGQSTLQAKQMQADNDYRNKQFIEQKSEFKTQQDWQKYTYTHMSASDKAQLDNNKKQYGEDAAWRMYELKYNGEIQKSTNQATINAYKP
jgi:hypothetical protein